ncbi:hypothetical protein NE237_003645 [Protea cynaroides]|uniref:Uncharacterized protein n=1 Tax=Protea cynaroides TaxID=273540 RepID=A0A9Q0KHR5_9MAGN|nr:hypothetical protein NE237_003645 [Protea cynaroides]
MPSLLNDEIVLIDASGKCFLTKPIFIVRRSSIIGRLSMTVEWYGNSGEEYQNEGSFPQRCCRFYDMSSPNESKDPPGFDAAFAMVLVLVLDQINGRRKVGLFREPWDIVETDLKAIQKTDLIKAIGSFFSTPA